MVVRASRLAETIWHPSGTIRSNRKCGRQDHYRARIDIGQSKAWIYGLRLLYQRYIKQELSFAAG